MFQNSKTEQAIWKWRWSIIIVAVLAALFGLQILRVNKRSVAPTPETRIYTSPGPLISGEVVIPAADYNATRIDLNRRARINGEFRTADIKSRVSVLIIKSSDLANWKSDLNYSPIARTGYVPGGRISPVVDAGSYLLILDNRKNNSPQSVKGEFIIE